VSRSKVINIRGTSGSGKSWAVRQWLNKYPSTPLFGVLGRKPEAYQVTVPGLARPLYALGPYETPCGGCDAVQPFELIPHLIRKYAAKGHVLFEGLLIGDTYGTVGKLLDQLFADGIQSTIIRLTTSLETCLECVQKRRADRGDHRPLDPTNTIAHYQRSLRAKDLFEAEGSPAVWLDLSAEEAVQRIHEILRSA
jgi:hypothetical protein